MTVEEALIQLKATTIRMLKDDLDGDIVTPEELARYVLAAEACNTVCQIINFVDSYYGGDQSMLLLCVFHAMGVSTMKISDIL